MVITITHCGKEPLDANSWQVKQKALPQHLPTKGREGSDGL